MRASVSVEGAGAQLVVKVSYRWRAELRKLLHDPDPTVRLRAVMARAATRDRDSVPLLIDLLDQLPATPAWQAEAALSILLNA